MLAEDQDYLTVEIAKHEHQELCIFPGDRVLAVVFVQADNGEPEPFLPWLEQAQA